MAWPGPKPLEPLQGQVNTPVAPLGERLSKLSLRWRACTRQETEAQRTEGPWQRLHLSPCSRTSPALAEFRGAAGLRRTALPPPTCPGRRLPGSEKTPDPRHAPKMQGTPGNTSADTVHQQRCAARTSKMPPLGPPHRRAPHKHIHKAHPCLSKPREHHCTDSCRALLGGCLYTKTGTCIRGSGGPPEPGNKEEWGRSPCPPRPRAPVRKRTHCLGNMLHGVRPQPAPFQSKGRGLCAPIARPA